MTNPIRQGKITVGSGAAGVPSSQVARDYGSVEFEGIMNTKQLYLALLAISTATACREVPTSRNQGKPIPAKIGPDRLRTATGLPRPARVARQLRACSHPRRLAQDRFPGSDTARHRPLDEREPDLRQPRGLRLEDFDRVVDSKVYGVR